MHTGDVPEVCWIPRYTRSSSSKTHHIAALIYYVLALGQDGWLEGWKSQDGLSGPARHKNKRDLDAMQVRDAMRCCVCLHRLGSTAPGLAGGH